MQEKHRNGSPDATVRVIASAQHGLIGRAQAFDAGVTARMIHRRTSNGDWEAVHRAVYRLAGTPVTWEQRVLAAALASGGVASHRAAARLWGLDLRVTERAVITVRTGGTGGRRGGTTYPAANSATAHGWRVLTATDLDLDDGCRALASDVGGARAA